MDPMAEIRLTFFQECEEQLAALENGLLSMQEGSADQVLENPNNDYTRTLLGAAPTLLKGPEKNPEAA